MKPVPVNKIIPLSLVDGPGNRTSIFLQGCNLSCEYCHNPETQKLCSNCGLCADGCPAGALSKVDGRIQWDKNKCTLCDRCINICSNFASPRIRRMSAEDVFLEIKKSMPFIRGITLSGGECTLYPEFLLELFKLAKAESLTCMIDSNGMIDLSKFPELISNTDGVMLDVKAWDNNIYKRVTGGQNDIVKRNLEYLARVDKLQEIRIVCIPGEVDAENVIRGIAASIELKSKKVILKLIKFRRYGVKGRFKDMNSPSDGYMEGLRNCALNCGFENIMIT